MKAFAALLFFVCSLAHAEWQDWDDKDKALLVTSTALLAADWLQTREIVEGRHSGYHFHETNPILGPHPSLRAVNIYMGFGVVSNYFIADWLGKDRWIWLAGVTAVEFNVVRNNYRIGIRMGF